MLIAQVCAFVIFKDLADISQWLVQSSREFTMMVWYNRHIIGGIAILALLVSLLTWWTERKICPTLLLGFFVFIFACNYSPPSR